MTNETQQTVVDKIVALLNKEGFALVLTEEEIKSFKEMEKEQIEMYKQCLQEFIPIEKWDDATKFLSTYGSGLAKELSNNETYGGNNEN